MTEVRQFTIIVDGRAKLEEQQKRRKEERAKLAGRLLADRSQPIQSESRQAMVFRHAIPET